MPLAPMRTVPFCGVFGFIEITAVIHIVFVKGPSRKQLKKSLVRLAGKTQSINSLKDGQRAVRPLLDV